MEGRRDDVTGAATPQGRYYGRRGGGDGRSGDESDGSSSGGVELGLRLSTGSGSPPPPAPVAAEEQEVAARRSMTIFYNGRVCAVDVTEIQAREIISMAHQQLRQDEGHLLRQGLATAAAPATDQAGLSMKRSLQRFLQKREARKAAAVAPPYAGGGRQAQPTRH